MAHLNLKKFVLALSLFIFPAHLFAWEWYDKLTVDNITIDGNTISTGTGTLSLISATNQDIVLDPIGTGGVRFTDVTASRMVYVDANSELTAASFANTDVVTLTGSQTLTNKVLTSPSVGTGVLLTNQAYVQFFEGTGGGTEKVTILAPATLGADYTLTLPANDGDASQFLTTDGSGGLSWTAAATGASTALDNLAAVAINTSLLPANTATINLGSASKIWNDGYVQDLKHADGTVSIAVEGRVLGTTTGGLSIQYGGTSETIFSQNLIPQSGGAQNIGSSSVGWLISYAQSIGYGAQTFVLPTAAGTAGQVLTNNGSAVSSWGSGPITARAHASTTTISGALATIVFDTEDFDNRTAMVSGAFTCPETGKYQVNASIALSGTFVLNNTTVMELQLDGTAVAVSTNYIAAAITNDQIQISDVVACTAASVIRIQVSNSGTTPAIVSSNTKNYISIARVGTL